MSVTPPIQAAVVTDTVPATPAGPDVVSQALELAQRLQQENAALASRNEQLAGQVGFLQARVQDQERQIALLMAPQEPEPTPAPEPERRPWWQRLRRRFSAAEMDNED